MEFNHTLSMLFPQSVWWYQWGYCGGSPITVQAWQPCRL